MIRKLNHEKSRNCFSSQSIIRRIKCFPLSTLLVLVIWVLCLIPIPDNVPFGDVPMMDKWTHFVMYGTLCTVLWWEWTRYRKVEQQGLCALFPLGYTLLYMCLTPVLMSGLIELAQAYCTGGTRSGDWLDFAANSIGVGLGNLIGILLAVCRARGRKGI